jgi:hypothetical protein
LYRAVDQYGQVIDVLVSPKRDLAATRRFFTGVLEHGPRPAEVTTDRAPDYPRVIEELIPAACHITAQYANNPFGADHGLLKARLRPMRGLTRLSSARVISTGHAFVQNLRRDHYELGMDTDQRHRLPAAFTERSIPAQRKSRLLPAYATVRIGVCRLSAEGRGVEDGMLAEQQLCADLSYRGGELVTALARREIGVKALDVPFDASPVAEVGRTGGDRG